MSTPLGPSHYHPHPRTSPRRDGDSGTRRGAGRRTSLSPQLGKISKLMTSLAAQVRMLTDRVRVLEERHAVASSSRATSVETTGTTAVASPATASPAVASPAPTSPAPTASTIAPLVSSARPGRPGLWCLYTDGGARPTNPGPSGAGMVLVNPSGLIIWEASMWLGTGTNNSAEYEAVALGVAHVVKRFGKILGGPLLVRSDSQLVLNCLSGKWKCRSESLLPIFHRATKAIEALPHGWKPEWVRGHDGNIHNERADKLATLGCYGNSTAKRYSYP